MRFCCHAPCSAYGLVGSVACAAAVVALRRDHPLHYQPQATLVDELGLGGADGGVGAAAPATKDALLAVSSALQCRSLSAAAAFRARTVEVLALQDHWQEHAARLAREYEAIAHSASTVCVPPLPLQPGPPPPRFVRTPNCPSTT